MHILKQTTKVGILVIMVISGIALGIGGKQVVAGLAESSFGWAWSGSESVPDGVLNGNETGIGWISMNSLDCDADGNGLIDVAACGTVGASIPSYGVNIPNTDGALSGYAWSERLGWISFNGADLGGCAPALTQATRTGNTITGGARVLSIRNAGTYPGGYDGCISLSGAGYGITITGNTLGGYAWSSDFGWINMTGVVIRGCPAITTAHCVLPSAPNGTTVNGASTPASSCETNYSGTCSATCSAGSWTITTNDCKLPAPANITGLCPAPGTTATISWPPVTGATYYMFRIDTQPVTLPHVVQEDSYLSTWYTFTPSTPGVTYLTWVHSCDGTGCNSVPASSVFACASSLPDVTSLIAPTVTGTLTQGSTVTFTGQVRNSGGTIINTPFTDNFTYCWGAGCSPATQLGGHISATVPLAVGGTQGDTSASLLLNTNGTLRVQHCVDSQGNISEAIDTVADNCKTSTFTVTVTAPSCTGTAPTSGANMCAGEPSVSTPYTYVATCGFPTSKCLYTCNSGYKYDGSGGCRETECYNGINDDSPEDTDVDAADLGCLDPVTGTHNINDDSETLITTDPDITARPRVVSQGDSTTLEWTTGGTPETSCMFTANGVNIAGAAFAADTNPIGGSYTVPVHARTTYVLTCGGLSDSVMVEVQGYGTET